MSKVMDEFWESFFKEGGTSWGYEPADSAILISTRFKDQGFSTVLIPGIGYGRNVKPFLDKGITVTGIEISPTAVGLLNEAYPMVQAYNGSVLDMPFGDKTYDGIYCYALLHLFNKPDREKIISSCFQQLNPNGIMTFCVISDKSDQVMTGKKVGANAYLLPNGLTVFFYNEHYITKEFSDYGLIELTDIEEPIKFTSGLPAMKFRMITCKKQ